MPRLTTGPDAPATVTLRDESGEEIAQLEIYRSRSGTPSELLVITETEAMELSEEPVQLLEGRIYAYRVLGCPSATLAPAGGGGGLVRSSPLEGDVDDRGSIRPGSNTGRLALVLVSEGDGQILARGAVEVRSAKLGYRDDYRAMLDSISARASELILRMRSPAGLGRVSDPGSDPKTLYQRFALLKSLLSSRDFLGAVERIVNMPHRMLEHEPEEREIRKGFRADAASLRAITRGHPRIPIPDGHPLGVDLMARGVTDPTLPERVAQFRKAETVDTAENRFVKHALSEFLEFFTQMENAVRKLGRADDAQFLSELAQLQSSLATILSHDFFRAVSQPAFLPLASPVLQRTAGYRELLQAWYRFNLTSRIRWAGGDDVFEAGKRDLDQLYEYWAFFELLSAAEAAFEMEAAGTAELLTAADEGIGLRLKAGEQLSLRGRFLHESEPLAVRVSYNRTFPFASVASVDTSWSRQMRPDVTVSLWPERLSVNEAGSQALLVHLHFDAKYRVSTAPMALGADAEDGDEEVERDGVLLYKRADLLKMHAYHDAIRGTEGSYVLYPGTGVKVLFPVQAGSVLPSIGAFPLRPTVDTETGIAALAEFLTEAAFLVSSRSPCQSP